ncbi:type II toxin-antitoxin system RelE/ParE family toxin [Flavobacterium sp.]|uniref:type II toxin-antitoxin system RelE/ParE family toxin n=1 Tax=Flavobacterium sp. TaxID=239 RepID=UPI00286AA708|nr:type II toxin-antitoxin system RelE/ParE family toxin [Flavobacterium sp.]
MGEKKTRDFESYSLIVSNNYYSNLQEIIDYIQFVKLQPLNAVKVGDGIQDTMNKIILNPTIYAECENIPTKSKIYREAVYKTWQIVFKLKDNNVTVLGVLSGKRKPSRYRKIK